MRAAEFATVTALLDRVHSPHTAWLEESDNFADARFSEADGRSVCVIGCVVMPSGRSGSDLEVIRCFPGPSNSMREAWALVGLYPEAASNLDIDIFADVEACTSEEKTLQTQYWSSEIEDLVTNLGRLQQGWAGLDSLPPKPAVLKDIETAIVALDGVRICPKAEVDSSDGTVALIWDHAGESFSIVFNGNGKAIGVMSPYRDAYPAWVLSVDDESGLAEKLDSDLVAGFIS